VLAALSESPLAGLAVRAQAPAPRFAGFASFDRSRLDVGDRLQVLRSAQHDIAFELLAGEALDDVAMLRVLRCELFALSHLKVGEVETGCDSTADECPGARLAQR
jgi:hypothetical protein